MCTKTQTLENRISSCSIRREDTLTKLENNASLLKLDPTNQQLRNECQYLLNEMRNIHKQYVILHAELFTAVQNVDNTTVSNLCTSFAEQCRASETRIKDIMPTVRTALHPSPPRRK